MALSFIGSAILVVGGATGCGGKKAPAEHNDEAMITRTVDSLELLSTENGVKKNMVITPIVESHALAKDPFDEYRLGIETRGYDEKTGLENFRVTADYALHFTHRELWDLKGNVSVVGQEGRQLFTQQLFWDEKLGKFYSNVDTKVTDGPSATVGTGFEADENLDRWSFRRIKGVVYVDTEPTSAADSLSTTDSLAAPLSTTSAAPGSERAAGAGVNAGTGAGAGAKPKPAASADGGAKPAPELVSEPMAGTEAEPKPVKSAAKPAPELVSEPMAGTEAEPKPAEMELKQVER